MRPVLGRIPSYSAELQSVNVATTTDFGVLCDFLACEDMEKTERALERIEDLLRLGTNHDNAKIHLLSVKSMNFILSTHTKVATRVLRRTHYILILVDILNKDESWR